MTTSKRFTWVFAFDMFRIGRAPVLCALVAVVWLMTMPTAAQSQGTWASRLGYPAKARVVILEAEGSGMCYETTAASAKLMDKNLVQSVSGMAPCPWFGEFAKWARKQEKKDIGVTLTLTSEWKNYRWRPVSPRGKIPGLADADGFLWSTPLQVTYSATPEEVRRELTAQIRHARSAGVRPSHFTSHQGALFMRPDLARVYLDIARKHWIPAALIELTPAHIREFREKGFPLSSEMTELIAGYPLPKVDGLKFSPTAETYEEKVEKLLATIKDAAPGITLIKFQPAVESEALRRITPDWQQRVWDAKLLADPKVAQFLKEEGVIMTDWREVMQRFDQGPPAEEPAPQKPKKKPAPKSVEPEPERQP